MLGGSGEVTRQNSSEFNSLNFYDPILFYCRQSEFAAMIGKLIFNAK
jgi:hypothetical protein